VSVAVNAATDRYDFTFPSTPPLAFQSGKFVVNGSMAFDGGFTPQSVSGNVVSACAGQDNFNAFMVPCTDLTGSASESGLTVIYAFAPGYGRVAGAVWMPTNSACAGQDSMIAVIYDVFLDNPAHPYRYVRCGKLN
jgi:hypothetical protein